MSIPLPPRPESAVKLHGKRGKQLSPEAMSFYTEEELRARDLEVARCVLEAAAKVCDHWIDKNHVYVNGALRCGEDIRALEFTHG